MAKQARKLLTIWEAERDFEAGGYKLTSSKGWWLKDGFYRHKEHPTRSATEELGSPVHRCWATSKKRLVKYLVAHLTSKIKDSEVALEVAQKNVKNYKNDLRVLKKRCLK